MGWTAFGEALPQAIAIAISPIPIVMVILVLVSPRARTSGPAFAVGWVAGLVALTAATFSLASGADVATDAEASDGANLMQIGLGLLFVFLAVKQWKKRPRPGVEPETPKLVSAIDSMPPLKVLGVGFASAAVNPKNLPLGISAGVAMAQHEVTGSGSLSAVLAFSLVASSAVIVPVVAVLILGDRTREPLDELKTWLLTNSSTIMAVVFVLLAAKMLGSGLALTS